MKRTRSYKACLLAGVAFTLIAPAAHAAESTAQLAARLAQMEAEMASMRGELAALREKEKNQDSDIIRIEQKTVPLAPQKPADGFRVGETTIKFGGYVKAEALYSDYSDGDISSGTGRDFFVPGSIPIGAASEKAALDMHAKQTRLSLTATRDVKDHTLQAYVEADFQSSSGTGTENVTNAYNFAVRRAYVVYDRWLFGQDWTTFQNVAALPETTDFIGPSDGTVFARQALLRYTHPIGKNGSLAIALENPETTGVSIAAPAVAGLDDDAAPDVVGRLNWSAGRSQFALAAIWRRLSVEDGGVKDNTTGWGVSASGKLAVGARDDLRFMITTGEGVGRYLGIGFAPDVIVSGGKIEAVSETGGFAAYRHVWADKWRSTLSYSFLTVDEQDFAPASGNKSSSSWAANLFYSPAPGLDIGAEYRHAEREIFSGGKGEMDRLHFIAKQSF